MKHNIFKSTDMNVTKFVFEKEAKGSIKGIAIEAVLYRYNSYAERTVICCSTQCGCPVGCVFCGTGKFFVRNLSTTEIVEQVDTVLQHIDCKTSEIKKFQIMFMSMGDPFLNFSKVCSAIHILNEKYPNAQLLISTSAPLNSTSRNFDMFLRLSNRIDKVGIQFSVHESNDFDRSKLIPTPTSSLTSIGMLGERFAQVTGRKPFFNYCVHENNSSDINVKQLLEKFDPSVWECTLSVICEKDCTMQNAIKNKLDMIKSFSDKMINAGYSIRIFNPSGQDDIGGGCGQLWFFQDWLKNNKN